MPVTCALTRRRACEYSESSTREPRIGETGATPYSAADAGGAAGVVRAAPSARDAAASSADSRSAISAGLVSSEPGPGCELARTGSITLSGRPPGAYTAVCTGTGPSSAISSPPGLTTIRVVVGSGGSSIFSFHSTMPGPESSSVLMLTVVTLGSSCSASCRPNSCTCWNIVLNGRARKVSPIATTHDSSIIWCIMRNTHSGALVTNVEVWITTSIIT
mmetsp:Transcript_388/g.982  ORF Transcript_388/g.982 Transcript_388/m.982 type:complete len:218 (+) Transcript_388:99-752(+)